MCISNYNPDVIARNVKQLGNGVIEVRRYNDGHIRADLSWVWFFCSIGFMLYDYFTTQSMINDMKWAISVDWGLEKSWDFGINIFLFLGMIKHLHLITIMSLKPKCLKCTVQISTGAGSIFFSRCFGSLW